MPTHPEFPHWRLRLSHEKNWEKQYTGFDPSLILPKELSDYHAMGFLMAEARFMDALLPHADALSKLYFHLRNNPEHASLAERATSNTSLTTTKVGIMNYLAKYMHEATDKKVSGKVHFNPYKTVLDRFKEACKTHKGVLSAHRLMERMADRVKPQYLEGWLLYRGQTIEELRAWADSDPHFPPEHKTTIEMLHTAYQESGLAAQVDRMRHWADSPLAQAERRTKVLMDMGKPNGIIPVGALDTGVRIAPKSAEIGRGT